MIETAKMISLKQSVFKPLFALTTISVLVFSAISLYSMKLVVEENNLSQSEIISNLFSEIITQDVLVGANYEVYKKCNNALSDKNILGIQVNHVDGTTICNVKKNNGSQSVMLRKEIFYDANSKEKAADINIYFSQEALNKLLRLYTTFSIALILFLFFIVYILSKKISNRISKPLQDLNEAMAMKSFIAPRSYKGDVEIQILEFHDLQEKFTSLLSDIDLYQKKLIDASRKEAVAKMAAQAAHDIRSPLEMLKGLKDEVNYFPESARRRIQLSINRIEEIAYNLLSRNKEFANEQSNIKSEEILGIVLGTITEKTIEFKKFAKVRIYEDIEASCYGFYAIIDKSSLKSILSNLINNSVESFINIEGSVLIRLRSFDKSCIIEIIDNGPGIPLDVLPRLFIKGFTTKKDGNGLGLYNAKEEIEAAGGSLTFTTETGSGTTFAISLPKSDPPPTFVDAIHADKYERIIILDDDPAFHEVWIKKLSGLEEKIEHMYSVREMFSRYQVLNPKILLLSDFDLMDNNMDGIDTILKLGNTSNSILVTARSEEQTIQERCLKSGIKLIPKSLVNYVNIKKNCEITTKTEKAGSNSDNVDEKCQVESDSFVLRLQDYQDKKPLIVLIDDDRLIHINWSSYCKKKEIPFKSFKSISEFLLAEDSFDKSTKIFIDSNLGDGIMGEIESEKIYNLGFENLYLATGYQKCDVNKPAWIKKVYSKSPESIDSGFA